MLGWAGIRGSLKTLRRDEAVLLSIILATCLFRLAFSLYQMPHGDDAHHLRFAAQIADHKLDYLLHPMRYDIGPNPVDLYPPMYYLITGTLFTFFRSDLPLKLVTPIATALSVLAAYLLFKDMYGRRLALLTAAIYSSLPLNLHYGSSGFMDSLVALFGVLSLLSAYNFSRKRSAGSLCAAAVLFSFGLLTKLSALIFALPLLYLVLKDAKALRQVVFSHPSAAIFTLIALLPGPLWYGRLRLGSLGGYSPALDPARTLVRFFDVFGFYKGYFLIPYAEGGSILSSYSSAGRIILANILLYLPLAALFVFGLFTFAKEARRRRSVENTLVLLWFASGLLLAYAAMDYFTLVTAHITRYLIPVLSIPFFMAYGAARLEKHSLAVALLLAVIGLGAMARVGFAYHEYNDCLRPALPDLAWVRSNIPEGPIRLDAALVQKENCCVYSVVFYYFTGKNPSPRQPVPIRTLVAASSAEGKKIYAGRCLSVYALENASTAG